MRSMDKRLGEWVSLGLLNEAQARAISRHEAGRGGQNWMIYGFAAVAALAIGIGIISLIAANWDEIPDGVKLATDFALLCGLAMAALVCVRTERTVTFEVLLVLILILCLATIGLISQVFHSGGRLDEALLFWAAICAPAMLFSRHLFVPLGWTGVALGAGASRYLDSHLLAPLWGEDERALALLMGLAPMLYVLAAAAGRLPWLDQVRRGLRIGMILFGVAATWAMGLVGVMGLYSPRGTGPEATAYLPGVLIGLAAAWMLYRDPEFAGVRRWLGLAMLAVHLALYPAVLSWLPYSLTGAPFTLTALALVALLFGTAGQRRLFHAVVAIMGAWLVTFYFEAFGGLAFTGFGLIALGGIMLALILAARRYLPRFQAWMGGLQR